MAVATTTWLALAAMAASAGVQYQNTKNTANRADATAAQGIRQQSRKQAEADAKVNEEVEKLKGSTADDERRQRLTDYMQTIQRSKGQITSGLTPQVGSDAFKGDAAAAAQGAEAATGDRAGLLARIDAPGMQRQGEGFGFGNLATDINMIGRESKGDAFINEMRLRAIRRNPYMDMLASGLSAAGSAAGSSGSTGGGQYTGNINSSIYGTAPSSGGGSFLNGYGSR